MDSFPRPSSLRSVDLPDCTVLCSSIPNSSLIVNKDQALDEFGVMQPTCAIFHDECVRESKEELAVKDDSLPAMPHLLHPDIHCDSATADFPRESPF